MLLIVILFLDDERDGLLPNQGQLVALDWRQQITAYGPLHCLLTHPLWRESLKALAESEHEEKPFRVSYSPRTDSSSSQVQKVQMMLVSRHFQSLAQLSRWMLK
jgi:hypothetical protein